MAHSVPWVQLRFAVPVLVTGPFLLSPLLDSSFFVAVCELIELSGRHPAFVCFVAVCASKQASVALDSSFQNKNGMRNV